MILPKANPMSLAAMAAAAVLFTACEDSPTSPRPVTSAEARADLKDMASKVRYFAPQAPDAGMEAEAGAKRTAARAGAASQRVSACDQEATVTEAWVTDSSEAGGATMQYDTTVSYTSANEPVCEFDDRVAYQITSSRSDNAMLETSIKTRSDLPVDLQSGEFRMTGSGTVRYKDGYLITITSMEIMVDLGQMIMKTYVMNLALEKGYTVVLRVAPGTDLMAEEEPGPEQVAVSGPISKDGAVVGYFEVMGDNRVIIRDADKVLIESHG